MAAQAGRGRSPDLRIGDAMHDGQLIDTDLATEVEHFLRNHPETEEVDAFIVDVNGNALGKRLPASHLRSLARGGVQFSACAPILDCRGLGHDPEGLGGADGDPDGTAMPVPGTLVPVPWARRPTAQVLCAMGEAGSGAPLWFDPRAILADVVARCRADGLFPVVACELEFYLLEAARTPEGGIVPAALPRTGQPPRVAANLALAAVEEHAEFLGRITAAAEAQRLPLAGAVAEYGLGQFEVNLSHLADPVAAADQAALLRRLVKGVARAQGQEATFMSKPFADQPGNGFHIHVSLVDAQGRNRFGRDGGEALLRNAIAGMQALMLDSVGILAPNFNAHRRYLGLFVPTSRAWAENNRSVAFRIPVGGGEARRVEHRVAGAEASPHLVMAAVLAAVHHGVTRGLEPTAPANGDAGRRRDPQFPDGILAALARLERSRLLAEYMPRRFLAAYAASKRGEYADLIGQVFAREYDFYL
jgi:glutamine synthetase